MTGRRCRAGPLVLLLLTAPALGQETTGLYERPVLVLEPVMHTAPIHRADIDAHGVYAVTGSHDRTVRVWSVANGKLLQTIRVPVGPGNVGRIDAVAISPDGVLVAAGGWTRWTEADPQEQIYLLDRQTGAMVRRLNGLPNVVKQLTFSPDGRYLAATLGSNGLRVYDRESDWAEVFRDTDYADQSYGAAFAADGRLATTSYDGQVRLYDADFRLVASVSTPPGTRPFDIAFSPDGLRLAVGYADSTAVDLFDATTLEPLSAPDTAGIDSGNLARIAWSADGATLFAGGTYPADDDSRVVAWSAAGTGARQEFPASTDTIVSLKPLPNGDLLVGSQDPYLGVLAADGSERWAMPRAQADFRAVRAAALSVATDGSVVDYSYGQWGEAPARFNLNALELRLDPPDDGSTAKPQQATLPVEKWEDNISPTLDSTLLPLHPNETSRSLAIHPDGARFVLGSDWSLRAFDAAGEQLWRRDAPGVVWAVNISGDGRLVLAGYGDGTIRWHRMDDGRELLAFFPLADRTNWVAWTPEGFYGATPGAYSVLRWHVNRGWDQAGESIPVAEIPLLRRPRVLPIVLQEMETARALGLDDVQQAMRAVQLRTRSSVPPGARLHLLAIGVSDYGAAARHLKLNYARQDAEDIANALLSTQTSLYAEVIPQVLRDGEATEAGILRGLATLRQNMAKGEPGQDLAVVHFSGHGAMIDGAFFLLPHGVDARDPIGIAASALPIATLREELRKIGEHGRVLVFLDACRSGAATADGREIAADATLLRTALATANVTVLTSSEAGELSREDEAWGNGAFTEALLEALNQGDDDRNGLISVIELVDYLATHVPRLTGNLQTPGMEARFQSDVFVAGL